MARILQVSNSFLLGKLYEYSTFTDPLPALGWQKIPGYDTDPPTFDASMSAAGLPTWWDNSELPTTATEGAAWDALLKDSTAKMFLVSNLIFVDVRDVGVGESGYASFQALVDFYVRFIEDVLIADKGASPRNIMYMTAAPVKPETYGEIDWSDLTFKDATEGNVLHNTTVCDYLMRPRLQALGCYHADTWRECLLDFPSAAAFTGFYMDSGEMDGDVHTYTNRGSRWHDTYLKKHFNAWLADSDRGF